MVGCVYTVLEAWQIILVTRLGNECGVRGLGFLIRQLLKLLLRLLVVLLRVELSQFASHLINKVCTVGSSRILIHLEDHVGC